MKGKEALRSLEEPEDSLGLMPAGVLNYDGGEEWSRQGKAKDVSGQPGGAGA